MTTTSANHPENERAEYERELERSNFVRAAHLAKQLGLAEKTIKEHQLAALTQFLIEYQNFEGAEKLIAEYKLTAQEFDILIKELLKRPELKSRKLFGLEPSWLARTITATLLVFRIEPGKLRNTWVGRKFMRTGKPTHLSLDTQIKRFAKQQFETLK